MHLDRLIELAFDRTPTTAEVEEVANSEHISLVEVLDRFARRVAGRYVDSVYSFGDADMAMNNLFGWATAAGDGLPEFAWKVFGAFDAGEFVRPDAPEDQQGEALTRTLLSGFLKIETVCPPFEEATRRLQAFLSENGWPTDIVWLKSGDSAERLQSGEAKRKYEFARWQGLGVCLEAVRLIGSSTFAVVLYPRDSEEAERLMYPPNGSLKLSVAIRSE